MHISVYTRIIMSSSETYMFTYMFIYGKADMLEAEFVYFSHTNYTCLVFLQLIAHKVFMHRANTEAALSRQIRNEECQKVSFLQSPLISASCLHLHRFTYLPPRITENCRRVKCSIFDLQKFKISKETLDLIYFSRDILSHFWELAKVFYFHVFLWSAISQP